jgi:arsenite/tail-anchored protein-transporting ATPase
MSVADLESIPALYWAGWGTRYLFFTGKGGVGKTTTASAVAVALADAGHRTLVISTDPASNLDDVFGIAAGSEPTAVPDVPGLFVSNLDPEAAAEAFKERAVGPYRGVLPASAIANMEEQLSGACTVEIAAFNEFTAVLADRAATSEFDYVVFDTAPTGHTLRLLTLPSAWSGYVDEHPAGASCLGPLAGLDQQREQYVAAVATLADALRPARCVKPRAPAASWPPSASQTSSW